MRNAILIHVWVLFLGFGLAVGVEGADLETGLVAHWKFNETEGTTAYNSSADVHHGTLKGDPQRTEGKLGGAIEFDGVDDEVEVPYSPELNPGGAFTVTAWARADSQRSGYGAVISSRDVYPQTGFMVYATPSMTWTFNIGLGEAGWAGSGGPLMRFDQWVHLAAVYLQDTQRFYVDGALVAERSGRNLAVNPGQELLIGAGANERDPHEYFFQGAIDEVRLYSRALEDQEVAGLVANDAVLASLPPEKIGEGMQMTVILPRNVLRYAFEVSDNPRHLVLRRENPPVLWELENEFAWRWTWEQTDMAFSRVVVEPQAATFGQLKVHLNPSPILSDGRLVLGDTWDQVGIGFDCSCSGTFFWCSFDMWSENFSADDPAIKLGFRPLGTRVYLHDESPHAKDGLRKGDQAIWMVKPSGRACSDGRPPICEVNFSRRSYKGTPTHIWHATPVDPDNYVALGDYFGTAPPPEGSPNRPVAVHRDLVYPVSDEWIQTLTYVTSYQYNLIWCDTDGEDSIWVGKRVESNHPTDVDMKLFNPARFFCSSCKADHQYMLRLPLPQSARPRLGGDTKEDVWKELITFGPQSRPTDVSEIYTSHVVTVPYTEVDDPRHPKDREPEWQRQNSPFYTLEREEAFMLMGKSSEEGTYTYTDMTGTSETTANTYSQRSAFTVNLDVGIGLQYKMVSGSIGVGISVTKEMGWETTQSFSALKERTVSYQQEVRQGESVGIWFRCYRLVQRDAMGEAVDANPEWMVDPTEQTWTFWPPRLPEQ